MDSFNAYIVSSGCLDEFPGNNASSFSVTFPSSFDIKTCEKAKWCMGLNSIGVTTNVRGRYNLRNSAANPMLVKLKCFNIRNQMLDNQHTNDVEIFEWSSSLTGYYFHEFEKTVFIPLLTSNLRNLKFAITDENNDMLRLDPTHPSILSVTFRKMCTDYKSFYVRLSSTSEFTTNTGSNYRSTLPRALKFKSQWFVGLRNISFPNSFHMFPLNSEQNEVRISNSEGLLCYVDFGNLPVLAAETLLRYINRKINSTHPGLISLEKMQTIH